MPANIPETIRAPIFAILLFDAFALIARSYLQLDLMQDGKPADLAENLSYLVVPPILAILLFPVLRQQRRFLARRFSRVGLTWKGIGIAILVGVFLRIAQWGELIGLGALGMFKSDGPNVLVGPIFSFSCPPPSVLLLNLLVVSFLTPIIEELISRGFLLYTFLNKGRLIAIIASSILFAIMHSPDGIPSAFVGGLFFAVLALNTGTLWAPMVAHATYNGLTVLDWVCLHGVWNPSATTPALIAVGIFSLSVMALSLYGCSRLVRQKCVGTN